MAPEEIIIFSNHRKITAESFFAVKIDGKWSKWKDFGECSEKCGGGIKERTRTCDNPKPSNGGKECSGKASEEKECNKQKCPG